ncbi:MAG: M23 family metallopeptidase [Clostridiales bacterium]|nr:M23 family metallopeptidase [Clostridiales bacterium]
MEHQTQVRNMRVKDEKSLLSERIQTSATLVEYPKESSWGKRLLQTDKLIRNFAVVGGLLLTLVAIKNTGQPQAQSVFSAIQESAGMEWDESLGKLSFVGGFLPEGVQEVWSETESISVLAPIVGETVHAWSEQEPYVEYMSTVSDVRAVADGEVMSIAHGLDEEQIIRVRHVNDTESIYGNLSSCYLEVGDTVYAGDIIASVLPDKPLAFEYRKDGRSINPDGLLIPQKE